MNLTFNDLYNLAVSVGFPAGDSAVTAAAIALAESGGNPQAVGDQTLGGSYGLWQVFIPAHPEYNAQSLFDPTYNAKAALAISKGGATFTPWSTYNSGAYKKYLAAAPAAPIPWAALTIIAAGFGLAALYINNPRPFRRVLAAVVP